MALYLGKKKITPIKVVDLPDDLDKELTALEENTDILGQKITELKDVSNETLNIRENGDYDVKDYGKVVVKVGENLNEIEIPEEIISATAIYNMKINDSKMLLTGNVNKSGIFLYNIKTKQSKKIYSNENGFYKTFQQVSDNQWLISGEHESFNYEFGLVLYNSDNDECTELYIGLGEWRYFQKVTDNKWLVGNATVGSAPLLLFNTDTKTIKVLITNPWGWGLFEHLRDDLWFVGSMSSQNYSGAGIYNSTTDNFTIVKAGGKWDARCKINENKWLLSSSQTSYNENKDIWLLDIDKLTCTKIYETNNGWINYHKVQSGCLIGNTNSVQKGILYFDDETEIISNPYTENYYYNSFATIGDETLIASSNNSYAGVLIYNDTYKTFTKLDVNKTIKLLKAGNDILATAGSSSYKGLYKYDKSNKDLIQIWDKGYNWFNDIMTFNDRVVLFSITSNGAGILSFNFEDSSITQLTTNGYSFTKIQVAENKYLLVGYYVSGAKLYNTETHTIVSLWTVSSRWTTYIKLDDIYLFGSADTSTNIYKYNVLDDTAVSLLKYNGGPFNNFKKSGNGCFISSLSKNSETKTYYYDKDTDEIKLYSVYVEVQ